MADVVRWGILGTGSIAKKFAKGLRHVGASRLEAVGSRTQDSAQVFGEEFGVPNRHPSYADLANDPEVDVVYIATPHSLHKENSVLCLNAGKAVLCEKPFTICATEAEEMVRVARQKRLFLMEAMWSRFLPVAVKVRELLADSAIGEVRMLNADFGFRAGFNPEGRLFNPALGGGGLLDVGVYCISLAHMIFGPPTRISGLAHLGETRVDEQAAVLLGYERGEIAITSCAVSTNTPQQAIILGTEGRIHLPSPWWCGTKLILSRNGETDQELDLSFEGNGYNFQADEVVRCLQAGLLESPIMPLDESLAIMRTMDAIRAQWGLVYPMEEASGDT